MQAKTVRELGFVVEAHQAANRLEFTALTKLITEAEKRIMKRLSENGIGPKAKMGKGKTTGLAVVGGTPIAAILWLFVQDLLERL